MKRDAAQTIFRTVVFAGAMLGANACSKKPAPTTPKNTATEPAKGDPATAGDQKPEDGMDPCGRPRGGDEEGGGTGRGFILS